MTQPMTPQQFEAAEGAADWRVLGDGACAFFRTDSMAASARFLAAIGAIDDVDRHPPTVDVRAGGVTVRLLTITTEYAGMTDLDLDLARRISAIAREQGLSGDTTAVQSFLVMPGAPDIGRVTPFWRAVLGYEPRLDSPVEDLVDPQDRGPGFWFETMDEPRADGGGAIHVGVWVPVEQAEARVAAALAAGGHLVRDTFAPSWWTLADAYGNEVDVATTAGRD